MENKKQILDVDFIGGKSSLTASEEKALNEYFQRKKLKQSTKPPLQQKTKSKRKHTTI